MKQLRLYEILYLAVIVAVFLAPVALAQNEKPPADNLPINKGKEKAALPAVDSEEDLRSAIQSAAGSENQIIVNLEGYLRRYPKSTQRNEIENEIYKLAVKIKDSDRTISYAEKLLSGADRSEVVEILTNLIATLRERKGTGDLEKALVYAERLVKDFVSIVAESPKPRRMSASQWQARKEGGLASVYLVRGRVYADLGQLQKAREDLRKSLDLTPLAGAASMLSEIAEKQQLKDEALDYALQAFVLALSGDEEVDLKSLRRRLSTLYISKKQNETGLGDRLLKSYDSFVRDRDARLAKLDTPNINAGITDPLLFKLTRLDGSRLEMGSLRGKVVVMNFWATWCGPCRTELPLFEKTIEKYKGNSDVAFIAVTTDEDRDLVAPFVKQSKYNLPVAFAENIDQFYAITAIPTTVVLDRKGRVSFRMRGFNPKDDFVAFLGEKIEMALKAE